ncbi:hypothetical protein ABLV56_14905 [Klebsiella sp. JB_Kp029]|uniref:hypothetical protein n=1 Tax=Klebsiella TaxID=570 RepID=UPI001159AE1D|nr:hypothetical protein [Klebsiella variicola]
MISNVRKSLKELLNAGKKLSISRKEDVFVETSFDYSMDRISYGSDKMKCDLTVGYIISPNPETGSTAPSIQFDDVMKEVKENINRIFKNNNLKLLYYTFDQSEVDMDPSTGTVSLSFSLNIQVIEKR